ncbi:MAG: Type II secretion system F domain protein [Candidatus Collierbacteria bacterium GW2011_GWC1_45_47]|uniref:Type II secretion system F domain protein n=5 Tax=Candidatus Collieribacteriota TaxID=1752725 RepID=A0A0G1HKT0_9BACT|nr:MAG: Type II secretion system F domain protein [Candidatus Collierbacteria bacterium GW2011_GWA1_44_12]KKT39263.1 MAG: Type II secretion system F domain protein [Candidatus Collierbacteria bacterium GW2011_GWF1_44_12]KKT47183.1 MAG: Type II secretion system F domain protein [Candidatus Collierbacteria bacterium GW2011_GWF2_44_15]KKT67868.1 MAG: Type II secretion system F domain protein [Candidatus Collierbacteria bacterium GW2011_GWB1_44_35]KKT99445.1 MAG: Type II secretion system F domain p
MKMFRYKVSTTAGESSTGSLEAMDEKQAAAILRSKGFLVTSLSEADELGVDALVSSFSKPKAQDIANFTRQLSTMIASGLPLVDALRLLKDQSPVPFKQVVEKVLTEVEGGSSLADAMLASGDVFSSVYIALVRAGETAGVLDNVLKKLADNLEKQREFASKTKGAMVYPAIVSAGMVVIVILMMTLVVPKLTAMYKDFGAELPGPTKALMAISGFFVNFWYVVAVVGIGGFIAFRNWVNTEVGGLVFEQLLFKVPIYGKLKRDLILTEFARTISVLLSAGISILDALNIVADTLGSKIFGAQVKQAALYVEKGVPLSDAVARIEGFPKILSQMVSVGEETGKLDEVLAKLANYYESESETKVKALTTAIEPLIMVVMGIGVGFLVIAVIMPIYNLTSQF